VDGLDFRDARLGRDEWLRYARRLEAVDGRQARLLRNKIETAVEAVPGSDDDTVVLVLTRLDRALLREIDQRELDAAMVPGELTGDGSSAAAG